MGPNFARTRATIFAVIGFIFLAAGVGVTVGTLDLARDSGGKPQCTCIQLFNFFPVCLALFLSIAVEN